MINEQIKVLNKIYSLSEDTHSILTPISLCDEMINSLNIETNKSILVVSNMEFLISLRKINVDMNNVHYTTSCPIKKQFAENIGVSSNNIHNLEYNNKEINFGTEDMKFDYIVQNPPYNPNSLWKKFVLKCINLLNDNGKMLAIHPDSWRKKSSHKKLFNELKKHISELHLTGFNSFDANISTDWYIYNKNKQNNITIHYENNDIEIINNDIERIYNFSQKSIPASIISKISKTNHKNGLINLSANSYGVEYTKYIPNGPYKQCGGVNRGTSWTNGDYHLTNEPTKYQFDNKIVMAYTRKLRATFFKSSDEIGCNRGYILLTDNINANPESLCLLYNSKMLWKLMIAIETENNLNHHPVWLLQSLIFDNLNVETEEELYKHYNLTQEEIDWIENE